jgi:hypothetical protein
VLSKLKRNYTDDIIIFETRQFFLPFSLIKNEVRGLTNQSLIKNQAKTEDYSRGITSLKALAPAKLRSWTSSLILLMTRSGHFSPSKFLKI